MRLKTQKLHPIGRYAIEMFEHRDHTKSINPPFLPTSMSVPRRSPNFDLHLGAVASKFKL